MMQEGEERRDTGAVSLASEVPPAPAPAPAPMPEVNGNGNGNGDESAQQNSYEGECVTVIRVQRERACADTTCNPAGGLIDPAVEERVVDGSMHQKVMELARQAAMADSFNGSDPSGAGAGEKREAAPGDGESEPDPKHARLDDPKPVRQLSSSKRAAQNRAAQRAFRERRDKYVKELEGKAAQLESALRQAEESRIRYVDALTTIDGLRQDNHSLRVAIAALGGHVAGPPPAPLRIADHLDKEGQQNLDSLSAVAAAAAAAAAAAGGPKQTADDNATGNDSHSAQAEQGQEQHQQQQEQQEQQQEQQDLPASIQLDADTSAAPSEPPVLPHDEVKVTPAQTTAAT